MRGRDRIGDKVVGAGEDALFRDPQAACDHSETQGVVILQRRCHHTLDDVQHVRIIPMSARLCQRNIVFIQQQNHSLSIVLVQQRQQELDGTEHIDFVCGPSFQL